MHVESIFFLFELGMTTGKIAVCLFFFLTNCLFPNCTDYIFTKNEMIHVCMCPSHNDNGNGNQYIDEFCSYAVTRVQANDNK